MFKLFLILMLTAAAIFADDRYFFVIEKQHQKEKTRWNITDWIDQRDRMRLMDLWLSMHSPSPYEFFLSARHSTGALSDGTYAGGWEGSLGAYAHFLGVELNRDITNYSSSWSGIVALRLLGHHVQDTNVTFFGGMQQETRAGETFLCPLAGVRLTLYLHKVFGLEGEYEYLISSSSPAGGSLWFGRWQGGVFIDYSFARILGGYRLQNEGGTLGVNPSGAYLGLKLFF